MIKLLRTTAFLLCTAVAAPAMALNFHKGMEAFDAGDYACGRTQKENVKAVLAGAVGRSLIDVLGATGRLQLAYGLLAAIGLTI